MRLNSFKKLRKKNKLPVLCLAILLMTGALSACAKSEASEKTAASVVPALNQQAATENLHTESPEAGSDQLKGGNVGLEMGTSDEMLFFINGKAVSVAWEDNASVEAIKKLISSEPLTIQLSMYGGFEQVGPIGTSLPRNDAQTNTTAGDIVLYSGNQMVVFYGSNTWAYTRLGHITDKTPEELTELLANGNVIITLATGQLNRKQEMSVRITAGAHAITATLYDNTAARKLWEKLPLSLPMLNLYGREMCYRMGNGALPSEEAENTGYRIGDIFYWPPAGSLVILYKQDGEVFEQQPIGHTDNDLSFFEGMADTEITFEKKYRRNRDEKRSENSFDYFSGHYGADRGCVGRSAAVFEVLSGSW